MNIGLIDADLIDNGTRFPNLALMKIAGYKKSLGNNVELILNEKDINKYDEVFISKVFTKTKEPDFLKDYKGRTTRGGTGYYLENAPVLPYEIEHFKPYYDLYKPYIDVLKTKPKSQGAVYAYEKASVGFTTRGCFRKCPFCVNKNKNKSELWSPIEEFLDPDRRFIFLLDDNVFACRDWKQVFEQLSSTKKTISFRQGLDLRLLDFEKAKAIDNLKYYSDVIFAFDNLKDKELIEKKLEIYRTYCNKPTSCYVLCGYYEQGQEAVESVLDRVEILSRYNVLPYIMQYGDCRQSEYRYVFGGLAGWFNFKPFAHKYNYFEACELRSKSAVRDAYKLLSSDVIDRLNKRYFK